MKPHSQGDYAMQMTPIATANATMSSTDLLKIINDARLAMGETEVRANDFAKRVQDELEGENYESFVVQNFNKTMTTVYMLNEDQSTLVAMRESKGVRRNVLAQLKALKHPQLPQNFAQALRLAADLQDQLVGVTAENTSLHKAIEAITCTAENIKFQQATKILGTKQCVLAAWLRDKKWDRFINKSRASAAYSESMGYCLTKYEHKKGVKPSGQEYDFTQIEFFITPKGMARLTKEFNGDAA